jgi:hypothetical protein
MDFSLRLATVEWHLVMHGLDSHDLVRLARCSRGLLRLVDNDLAWTHALISFGEATAWLHDTCSYRPIQQHSRHFEASWPLAAADRSQESGRGRRWWCRRTEKGEISQGPPSEAARSLVRRQTAAVALQMHWNHAPEDGER